MYRHCF